MKIEIEDKEVLDRLIVKFIKSPSFQDKFNFLIREQIKLFGNEFFELGYKRAIKDKFEKE